MTVSFGFQLKGIHAKGRNGRKGWKKNRFPLRRLRENDFGTCDSAAYDFSSSLIFGTSKCIRNSESKYIPEKYPKTAT